MFPLEHAVPFQSQANQERPRRSLLLDELFEDVPEAILLLDRARRAVRANREFVRMFGYSREEIVGQTLGQLIIPEERREEAESFARLRDQGQTIDVETVRMRKDGQRIDVSLLEVPIGDCDGTVCGYAIYRDITERKLAEKLQAEKTSAAALRADVSNAFSDARLPEMLRDCTDAMVRHLDAAFARIWTVNQTGDVLELQASSGIYTNIDGIFSRQPLGKPIVGVIAKERQPFFSNDVPNDARAMLRDLGPESEGLMAVAGYPLLAGERVVGVMAVFSRAALKQSSLETLAAVADAIAHAIERKRLERELQHERDRLRLLLDLNNRVASHLELRQVFQAISSELRRIFRCDAVGLALPEKSGKQLRQLMIDFPDSKGTIKEGITYSSEGSLSGFALASAKPFVLNTASQANDLWGSDIEGTFFQRVASQEGIQSGCFLPLISADRTLGVLQLISRQERAFAEHDVEFLDQVAHQVAITLRSALEYEQVSDTKDRLAEQKLYLEDEIRGEQNFEEIVGNSPKLKAVLDSVELVAPADSAVLILGETGTGKELIARAIHDLSHRKDHAFVKVNCAAIPSGLLESELFGHEKGAFTGAIAQKIGRFELAHKGTLFLDEVGDIPLELQPKLLRVLQEQEFERLGSTRTQRVDVRVLAATNADLTKMVEEKKFRSDLYYRLNVFPVAVPPLRERRDDVPHLVRHFANKYARRIGRQIESIPKEAMDALSQYAWPGNIRELQNLIERSVLLSTGPSLRVPLGEIPVSSGSSATNGNALKQAERDLILEALRESNWVVGGSRGAAARLGLKRTGLAYKMQKLGISRQSR
jgi:formate hydrogenlyase transcriptional activator